MQTYGDSEEQARKRVRNGALRRVWGYDQKAIRKTVRTLTDQVAGITRRLQDYERER